MPYIPSRKTNRTFHEIDEVFGSRLSSEIKRRLRKNRNLVVLDIGCGILAETITTLTRLHPSITGIGMDYAFDDNLKRYRRLYLVEGDLFQMPFQQVADVAYSAYLLPGIISDKKETEEKRGDAVFEIAGALKNNGVAYVDERLYSSSDSLLDDFIRGIEKKHSGFGRHYSITRSHASIENYLVVRRHKKQN